jgi:magnesium transporter
VPLENSAEVLDLAVLLWVRSSRWTHPRVQAGRIGWHDFRHRQAGGEREYLQGVIEFYQTVLTINAATIGQAQNEEVKRLTEASYTQNEEVKKISAWAAIFFAPTLIGTVYGMNFTHMPELHWAVGYPSALVLMALSSIALYCVFKSRGWL